MQRQILLGDRFRT